MVAVTAMLGMRRLPRSLVVGLLITCAGIALQALGDVRIVDAMWRTTGDPASAASSAGHDLAGLGDLVVLVGGFVFALVAGLTRRVRPAFAVLAAVMVIIPPPFLWPAAGVLLVLLHLFITGRELPTSGPALQPGPPARGRTPRP
ncbi:MAG: hypothetical protein M3527_00070 [Actinomycetota bacterium]|nr:hypothetical protein [Actinomycetota bacterium]